MVNIWTILNCAKKIFFGKIIYSTHQKKCFSTILGNFRNWIFKGISTGADLTKIVKICIISIGKIIYSTHQRKFLSTIFRNFWKIEFLKEYPQARTLQKWWNLYYLKLCKEIIFWQNYLFHSSKESFSTILREFWKIELLKEYRQVQTLQKLWKFEPS